MFPEIITSVIIRTSRNTMLVDVRIDFSALIWNLNTSEQQAMAHKWTALKLLTLQVLLLLGLKKGQQNLTGKYSDFVCNKSWTQKQKISFEEKNYLLKYLLNFSILFPTIYESSLQIPNYWAVKGTGDWQTQKLYLNSCLPWVFQWVSHCNFFRSGDAKQSLM